MLTMLMRTLLPVVSGAQLESFLRMIRLFADDAVLFVPPEEPTPGAELAG